MHRAPHPARRPVRGTNLARRARGSGRPGRTRCSRTYRRMGPATRGFQGAPRRRFRCSSNPASNPHEGAPSTPRCRDTRARVSRRRGFRERLDHIRGQEVLRWLASGAATTLRVGHGESLGNPGWEGRGEVKMNVRAAVHPQMDGFWVLRPSGGRGPTKAPPELRGKGVRATRKRRRRPAVSGPSTVV